MYTQQKLPIQKVLDDNSQLILLIIDLQSKGKQNECLEHQRTLYRNLTYLIQFDSSLSHHQNNLPLPDVFSQTHQSDQIYRTQTNNPVSSNILNQNPSTNSYISSTPTNSLNKPTISQQRPSYLQQGRVVNNNSSDSSYPIQQNGYGQYPIHHQQQNSSTNTQNLVSYNNYNEQQIYYPQQQQWQNQSRQIPPQT